MAQAVRPDARGPCDGGRAVTVILKPPGRGNWSSMVLEYQGPRLLPMLVAVGDLVTLAGVLFRVCEVRA